MSLTYPALLRKAILARRKKPSQQFGQANDGWVWNGMTACTHTVLQWIAWFQLGKWYTLNQVNTYAGCPRNAYTVVNGKKVPRGLRPDEVQRFCDRVGLQYKVVRGWSALQVARASKLGPVGFAHMYSWVPEWKGYRYGSVKADGSPNGYATPTGKAGKTQLSGFTGRHFGLLLGYATDPKAPDLYYIWEPNHGSPVRPEKPPYDRVSWTQFYRLYDSYQRVGGQTRYALVPKGAKQ